MSADGVELVKLVVDDTVCICAGMCEMLEEETFAIDDDTAIAKIIGEGVLPKDRASEVVDSCPSQAISIGSTDAPRSFEDDEA